MSITATALAGLAWSAGGAIVGYVIGTMTRRDQRPRWQEWLRTLFGLLILALVAYTTVVGYRVNSCQAERNAAFAAGIAERSEAARLERSAQRTLLLDVEAAPNPAARAEAYRRYLASLDAADARRDAAPPTDVATQECR